MAFGMLFSDTKLQCSMITMVLQLACLQLRPAQEKSMSILVINDWSKTNGSLQFPSKQGFTEVNCNGLESSYYNFNVRMD